MCTCNNKLSPNWNSPGENTGVGSCSRLQGIFSTLVLNPGLPHCRQILYQACHQKLVNFFSDPLVCPVSHTVLVAAATWGAGEKYQIGYLQEWTRKLENQVGLVSGLSYFECEVGQLCPTLCDPMDYSLPDSSVHGIFQARVLEWGAIAFSVLIASQGQS